MAEWAEYYDHDRVVVMQIPLSLCLDYKATEADVEELSSLAALVEGTDCGVTLRELKDGKFFSRKFPQDLRLRSGKQSGQKRYNHKQMRFHFHSAFQ